MFRHFIGGVLCVALSVGEATATDADPASPSRAYDAPFAIFDDETYRRDGAITKFRTCLAIADDPKVQNVWDHDDFTKARTVPAYDLVPTLLDLPDSVRLQRGFGTVLACAYVVSTWYADTIGSDPEQPFRNRYVGMRSGDGRFEHGAAILDLGLGDDLRAFIEPVALARILTSPGLLPKASFGGIIVRNAIVNGPLVMHNLHLTSPLAFVNVKFVGWTFSKELFDNPRETEHTALAIAYSQFDHHILIANSEICGRVNVKDSLFRETLAFERVTQKTTGCQPTATVKVPPYPNVSVWISSTRFEQGLSFVGTHLDRLRVIGNRIDSFVASTSSFGRELRLWENEIGSLQVDCSILARKADISYNQVQKDLFIYGTRKSGQTYGADKKQCDDWWLVNNRLPHGHSTALTISSNRIGGGLGLLDLDGTMIAAPIDLSSNRVGNGSEIEVPSDAFYSYGFPDPWMGVITLEGSTYEGTITISRAPSSAKGMTDRGDGDYCDPHETTPPKAAIVDLTAARIRTLGWNLPFTCDFRWRGYGLTYDLWRVGDDARASAHFEPQADDQSVLPFWRQMLEIYEPASLNAMSQYLADKGSSVSSRSVLLEAKRLNYAPACPPDWMVLSCPMSMEWPSGRVLDEADGIQKASFVGASLSSVLAAKDYVIDVLMLLFLWPGGYGAAPEQAILIIGVLAVVFYYVYRWHSKRLQTDLDLVPGMTADMSWLNTRSIAEPADEERSEPIPPRGILREEDLRPSFAHSAADEDRSFAGNRSDEPHRLAWPDEDLWASLGMEKRLKMIHDELLPEIKGHADATDGPDQKKDLLQLRAKLEEFGNTETLGFSLFDRNKMPTRFTHWLYSVDTMLPFIDLHAYGNYYPESGFIRACSVVQHVLGWWLITVFIASAAIL